MELLNDYTAEEQLKSLSAQLRHFARERNDAADHIDQRIKSENLLRNLSLTMAHILLELHFTDCRKEVFLNIIGGYNSQYGTQLSFEEFEAIHWIRIVSGDAVLPAVLQSLLWGVGYAEQEGKIPEIPNGREHLVRCLRRYFQYCSENVRPMISGEKLQSVLNRHAPGKVDIAYLRTRGIIEAASEADAYYWKGGDFERYLADEIGATLWLLITAENPDDIAFRKFFRLIKSTNLWLRRLSDYLYANHTTRICELALNHLRAEPDLIKSDVEFEKSWLDSQRFSRENINAQVPYVPYDYTSPLALIKGLETYEYRIGEALDVPGVRSFCGQLIRLIVNNDPAYPKPYQNTLSILRDTSRPFLIWDLYGDIARVYPFVVPYLLTDDALLPLAFKLIDKIEIHPAFLTPNEHGDEAFEAQAEQKNKFWLQMFSLVVAQLSNIHRYEEEYGRLLAMVMLDVAEKVFLNKSNTRHGNLEHTAMRKRYDEAIKILGEKRNSNSAWPPMSINPRFIFSILPVMLAYLKGQYAVYPPNEHGYIQLQSGLLDLSIETLRYSKLRVTEREIHRQQQESIFNAAGELLQTVYGAVTDFYTCTTVSVPAYFSPAMEEKRADRGVHNFGFELIDWGYLFLHFEAKNLLQPLHERFVESLTFKTDGDRYDDENREQYQKIVLYLKSLLFALITIQKQYDEHEIAGLPVKTTLQKLEVWIQTLARRFSMDNLPQERMDVFDEHHSLFGHNMHYQSLITLLYEAVNYFDSKAQHEFIQNYFSGSRDIGRMLAAINLLDSKPLTKLISEIIKAIPIEEFIASRSTPTELQYALLDAANSEKHWELAKPIAQKLQRHFERVHFHEQHTKVLLYEVNMLIAYKDEDLEALNLIEVPEQDAYFREENARLRRLKQFYLALFKLYQEKDFDGAIIILNSLRADEPKNVRFAFQLYRAETLKALEE